MSTVSTRFTYNVEDINNNIRRTNVLLRAANAIRLTFRDLKQVTEKPTFTNIMWTLIQLSRTYNALRRVYNLVAAETSIAAAVIGTIIEQPSTKPIPIPPMFSIQPLNITVEAFRNNLPLSVGGLDISDLPEKTLAALQILLEEDADETVADAKAILASRIGEPYLARGQNPPRTTGDLEASIGWMPDTFGTRIYANAFYAWWVEEGQRTFTGYHYLKGATDLARQRLPDKIHDELNQLIFQGT